MNFLELNREYGLKFILLILLLNGGSLLVYSGDSPTPKEILSLVEQQYDSLFQLHRHLHSNPELSYREAKTAERVARELESAGFQITTNFGGYGLVGVMNNGEGPTLMIRTDLDGLPVAEETGLEYASRVRVRDDLGKEVG